MSGLDRRSLGLLLTGHVCVDLCQGAVPALPPFLLGQAYLPSRVGLASGITLGLAIALGGVAATALGLVADAAGLEAALWTIAALPAPALLLSLSLPTVPARRRPGIAVATAGNDPGR